MKKLITTLIYTVIVGLATAQMAVWQHRSAERQPLTENTQRIRPEIKTPIIATQTNPMGVSAAAEGEGITIYAYSQNTDDYLLNGPVKFNSSNPSDMTRIATNEDEITAGAYGEDAYYVMCKYQYFYPGGLYKVDLESGELTLVASYIENYNVRMAVDMSYDYTSQTMYMIYPSDNDSYLTAFGSVNLETGEQTFINAEMDRYVRAMAIDQDGTIYGIDENGMLITIDKATGVCTDIVSLNCTPFYRQSMEFDRRTGDLYWAYSDTYSYGTLKKVDVSTGVVTTLGKIGSDGDEQVLGLYIPYSQCEPGAPAKVDGFSIAPNDKGELNATLSWTCPSSTFEGETLSSISKVELYRQGELITTLTDAQPGKQMTYTDNVTESGTYTYKVVCHNENGQGVSATISSFVGRDLPSAVKITSVKRIGQDAISLTWESSETGINNGYLDKESIRYKVTRISDNKVMAEGLTATTYTDNTITELNRYRYEIEVSNADGIGGVTTTGYIVNGPARELPLNADFSNEEEAGLWSVGDANGDGVFFFWSYNRYEERGYYYYQTEWDYNANDWLLSPLTKFEAGKNYKAIVHARPANDYNPEKMEYYLVKDYNLSTAIKISDTFNVVGEYDELINDVHIEEYRADFSGIEAGEYSMAIRCVSDIEESYWLALADVEVAENHDGHIRGDVWDDEENPVEGVLIQVDGTDFYTYTDSRGQFEIKNILQGDYTVTCSKLGYFSETIDVTVTELQTKTIELDVKKRKEFAVRGTVNDEYGQPLDNTSISITGYNTYSATTDENGKFSIDGVYEDPNAYTVTASKPFFEDTPTEALVSTKNLDLSIVVKDQILPPALTIATTNENQSVASIEWAKPGYSANVKKHSEDGEYTFGTSEGDETTLIGIVYDQPVIIDELTWCLFADYESINVVILALDKDGNCTDKILYKDDDALSNNYNYTTYTLSSSVYAPYGCFIGLSCDYGYLGLLTTYTTDEYPFVMKYNAFLEDYTQSLEFGYAEDLGVDYQENFCLSFKGKLLADENAPATLFNVYRLDANGNATMLNADALDALTFNDTSWQEVPNGTYRYAVTAKYNNGKESEQAVSAELAKTNSGIDNVASEGIMISVVNSMLTVSQKAELIQVYAPDGKQMISATDTSSISVASLSKGIYLVRVVTEGKNITKKINIK